MISVYGYFGCGGCFVLLCLGLRAGLGAGVGVGVFLFALGTCCLGGLSSAFGFG